MCEIFKTLAHLKNMRITICSSLDFTYKIGDIRKRLIKQGHEVLIPKTAEMILNGKLAFEQIMREKETGEISNRAIRQDAIREHFRKIKKSDAILVLNFDKKGIKNYIGGSVFLEMGFAYILNKKIFLLNEIPDMIYKDEIKAMQPIVLKGDLSEIK
ncbi:MAG: hypothetical protein DRP03_01005 [Candidatus Aenigmatarchaeota archaeon]|nr:MAG: hypothetical protein DRP03_01005 [Candidatus Aenigmarchaeota archaeon]